MATAASSTTGPSQGSQPQTKDVAAVVCWSGRHICQLQRAKEHLHWTMPLSVRPQAVEVTVTAAAAACSSCRSAALIGKKYMFMTGSELVRDKIRRESSSGTSPFGSPVDC